jgi:hypothetical protein
MQITINPADENPSTLRAVALMLSSIASDQDGAKGVAASVAYEVKLDHLATLPANPGNAHDAPGASDQSQIPPPPPLTGATAQTDANGSSTELDANGLPWIAEIHSTSKNKNQDGTWRYIRGGDPEVRAQVEARVRAEMADGAQASDVTPPPPPPLNIAPADDAPPPPPPIAEPQTDTPPANQVTMQQVFSRANKMPIEERNQALELVGLASMTEFLKAVKADPTIAGALNDALSAISGEE